uniref:Uncharacterized protein n=1 Tax=Octopus bimaculoides TaxID=37653 RepID=A0A0L8G281_OCTBM
MPAKFHAKDEHGSAFSMIDWFRLSLLGISAAITKAAYCLYLSDGNTFSKTFQIFFRFSTERKYIFTVTLSYGIGLSCLLLIVNAVVLAVEYDDDDDDECDDDDDDDDDDGGDDGDGDDDDDDDDDENMLILYIPLSFLM